MFDFYWPGNRGGVMKQRLTQGEIWNVALGNTGTYILAMYTSVRKIAF